MPDDVETGEDLATMLTYLSELDAFIAGIRAEVYSAYTHLSFPDVERLAPFWCNDKKMEDLWRDFAAAVMYTGLKIPWQKTIDAAKDDVTKRMQKDLDWKQGQLNTWIADSERAKNELQQIREAITSGVTRLVKMIELLIGQDLTHRERDGQLKLLIQWVKDDLPDLLDPLSDIPF